MTSTPRRRRPVLVPVLAAVAVGGLGATAAAGGLAEAAPEAASGRVASLVAGKPIDQGQFQTQVIKGVDSIETVPVNQKKRYVDLILKVRNMGQKTAGVGSVPQGGRLSPFNESFGASVIKVTPEIKTKFGPRLYVLSYGIESTQLHPDITATLVIRYDVEANAQVPPEVTIELGRYSFAPLGLRDQTETWTLDPGEGSSEKKFVPAVAGRVTVPIRKETA